MKLIYTLLEVVETKKNDKYIIYPDFQGIDNPTKKIDGINKIIDVADAIGNEQNKDYTYFRTEKKDYIDNMIKDAKNDGWKNFEPIVAIKHPLIPGKFCVLDGNHRLGAFKIGKIPKIKATIISNDHILLALPGSIYKKDISPKTTPFKNAKGKVNLKKYFNTKKLSKIPYKNKTEMTERCWKGYTQKGMKTMFGKRYPNCVKSS